jgi:hypothetical protein
MRDTDQSEKELLTDLFNMLEYENNGRLTINKLTLLAREKFNIHIDDDQAKEMIQALGVKTGKHFPNKRHCNYQAFHETRRTSQFIRITNSCLNIIHLCLNFNQKKINNLDLIN